MNDAPHDGRHDRTRERAARVIYEAPIGEYVGREGAEVLAQYAGEERSLADREMLYRAGDPSDAFFIVTDGRLALVREGNEQNPEVIIHVLERGDLIGEQSFLGGTRHATSCVALGAARVPAVPGGRHDAAHRSSTHGCSTTSCGGHRPGATRRPRSAGSAWRWRTTWPRRAGGTERRVRPRRRTAWRRS
ncbi:MAG: cyclic nucleotide-binding domain-containing protein [Nocardioides sp.]